MSVELVILSKSKNYWAEDLNNYFKSSHIIYDDSISDDLTEKLGFCEIDIPTCKRKGSNTSAWDKAFLFLNKNLDKLDDYVWFIEDDVWTKSKENLNDLFTLCKKHQQDLISNRIKSKSESQDWFYWSDKMIMENSKFLNNHIKSFNPICRISKKLIIKILMWKAQHGKFMFHEILFASLCKDHDLEMIDFSELEESYVFGEFRWRPVINKSSIVDNKIYHPVKPDYL